MTTLKINLIQDLIWVVSVWLPNRFISAELESVLSHTEKACITSYNRKFSKEYENENHNIYTHQLFLPGPPAPWS